MTNAASSGLARPRSGFSGEPSDQRPASPSTSMAATPSIVATPLRSASETRVSVAPQPDRNLPFCAGRRGESEGSERHVCAAGLEHRQRRRHRLRPARHAQRDASFGAGADAAEILREPVGLGVELRVGDLRRFEDRRNRAGHPGGLLLEPFVQASIGRRFALDERHRAISASRSSSQTTGSSRSGNSGAPSSAAIVRSSTSCRYVPIRCGSNDSIACATMVTSSPSRPRNRAA